MIEFENLPVVARRVCLVMIPPNRAAHTVERFTFASSADAELAFSAISELASDATCELASVILDPAKKEVLAVWRPQAAAIAEQCRRQLDPIDSGFLSRVVAEARSERERQRQIEAGSEARADVGTPTILVT